MAEINQSAVASGVNLEFLQTPRMETTSSSALSNTSRVDSAFNRFNLLLGDHISSIAGSRTPITTGNTPHFPPPPLVHRKFAFLPKSSDGELPTTIRVSSSHVGALTQLDKRYTRNVKPLPQTKEISPDQVGVMWEDAYLSEFPPEFINRHWKKAQPGSGQVSQKRICMKCWTGLGTLYCDQCACIMCAPCGVISHSEGLEKQHIITAVGGETLASKTHLNQATLDNREKKYKPRELFQTEKKGIARTEGEPEGRGLAKRRFSHVSAGSFSEALEKIAVLLKFRPLPDPNYALPPMSNRVLKIAQKEIIRCSTHPDQAVTKACRTCSYLPICDLCGKTLQPGVSNAGRHSSHHVVTLEEGANEAKLKFAEIQTHLRDNIIQIRQIQRHGKILQRNLPSIVRALLLKTRQSYQRFFSSLSNKYSEVHTRLAQVQTEIAKAAKDLSDDNFRFRHYLLDFKIPQLRSLITLGNRKQPAGLNAYVIMKPTLQPLLKGINQLIIDAENPKMHPWWTLNPSGARESLSPLTEKVRDEINDLSESLVIIGMHIQRILRPTEEYVRHPIEQEEYQKERQRIYRKAKVIEDITPITSAYIGPLPHTPEFNKLVPDMEGLMYRRDPFNDWGIVRLSLVSTFLIISLKVENEGNQEAAFLSTESLVPLLEDDIEIKLFTNPDISTFTRQSLRYASEHYGLNIVNGLEIIRKRGGVKATGQPTFLPADLLISSYWLLGTDTSNSAELWYSEIQRVRLKYPKLPKGQQIRIPIAYPGILPPHIGIRHPPIPMSHKIAAVEGFGDPNGNNEMAIKPPSEIHGSIFSDSDRLFDLSPNPSELFTPKSQLSDKHSITSYDKTFLPKPFEPLASVGSLSPGRLETSIASQSEESRELLEDLLRSPRQFDSAVTPNEQKRSPTVSKQKLKGPPAIRKPISVGSKQQHSDSEEMSKDFDDKVDSSNFSSVSEGEEFKSELERSLEPTSSSTKSRPITDSHRRHRTTKSIERRESVHRGQERSKQTRRHKTLIRNLSQRSLASRGSHRLFQTDRRHGRTRPSMILTTTEESNDDNTACIASYQSTLVNITAKDVAVCVAIQTDALEEDQWQDLKDKSHANDVTVDGSKKYVEATQFSTESRAIDWSIDLEPCSNEDLNNTLNNSSHDEVEKENVEKRESLEYHDCVRKTEHKNQSEFDKNELEQFTRKKYSRIDHPYKQQFESIENQLMGSDDTDDAYNDENREDSLESDGVRIFPEIIQSDRTIDYSSSAQKFEDTTNSDEEFQLSEICDEMPSLSDTYLPSRESFLSPRPLSEISMAAIDPELIDRDIFQMTLNMKIKNLLERTENKI